MHNLLVVAAAYARKYSLNGLFLIDDSALDPDATNTHGKATSKVTSKASNDDKPWLNENTPEFTKVKAYLKGGGNLANVESKYKISKNTKDALKK